MDASSRESSSNEYKDPAPLQTHEFLAYLLFIGVGDDRLFPY